jgi:hypothetical protein
MSLSQEIKWASSASDAYGASITATSLTKAQGLVFNDFGLVYNDMSSGVPSTALPLFAVNYITGSTSWPSVSAATGTGAPGFSVVSNTNTNVDLQVLPKGTGGVIIGNMPASCSGRTTGTLVSTSGHGGAVTWC